MQDFDLIWNSVKEFLLVDDSMPQVSINLWFGDATLVFLDDRKAVIKTTNSVKKGIIEKRFVDKLEYAFTAILNYTPEINIITEEEKLPDEADEIKENTQIAEPVRESVSPAEEPQSSDMSVPTIMSNSEYTFENFIVGSSNNFAHSACIAVAKNNACEYNPLFIYGNSGLGKTHLLNAIINELVKNNPQISIIYTKGEQFTTQMIESIERKSQAEFRQKYRKADVLLIDDIQFIAGKEATQEEFFHTFNELYENNKQIILTSDRPPKEIKTLENRLKTRFESGLIADVQPPDFELRVAILKNKSKKMNVKIPDEVLTFIAENLKQNIRQLEGAIKRICAHSFLSGKPITLDMAKECLSAFIGGSESPEATAKRIVSLVAKRYGIPQDDIYGKKRQQQYCHARNVCMYIIKKEVDMSYPAIGKMFNRDHTTVMSSCSTIEANLDKNLLNNEINEIIKELNE